MFTFFLCLSQWVDPSTEMALKQSGMFVEMCMKDVPTACVLLCLY